MALQRGRFTSYSQKYSTVQTIICYEALLALRRGERKGREGRGRATINTAERGERREDRVAKTNHNIAISTVGIERLFTNYPFW